MTLYSRILFYILIFVIMPLVYLLSLVWVPPAKFLGDASRILYFHVPVAWISVVSFIIAGYQSVRLLLSSNETALREQKSCNAATSGIVFTLLTVITGSIWARISWGSYWNWDPRETSIVILLLIYISWFSLYSALKDNINRGRISAVYLIIAALTMPFFIFIIPRVYLSLHPDTLINAEGKIKLESSMRYVLFLSIAVFTIFYGYIYRLMNRISSIEKKIQERNHDY